MSLIDAITLECIYHLEFIADCCKLFGKDLTVAESILVY